MQKQQQGVSRKLSLFQIFQKYQFMARDPYIHIVPTIEIEIKISILYFGFIGHFKILVEFQA